MIQDQRFQWVIAAAVLSVVMLSYIHGFVYTRPEGEKLEAAQLTFQSHVREDLREIRNMVSNIQLLLRDRSK